MYDNDPMEITTEYLKIANSETIGEDSKKFPLPLDVFPNQMGINLCSVEGMTWTKLGDGQLVSIIVHFIPAKVKPVNPATLEETP